jgi:hypothetical protein
MIGQLHLHLPALRLDHNFLRRRFPDYRVPLSATTVGVAPGATSAEPSNTATAMPIQSTNLAPHILMSWLHSPIAMPSKFKSLCHGSHVRTPGRYGADTHETIAPTVRLRGYGRTRNDTAMIPGYIQEQRDDGAWEWRRAYGQKSSLFWLKGEKKMSPLLTIPEGEMSPLEAALLGYV